MYKRKLVKVRCCKTLCKSGCKKLGKTNEELLTMLKINKQSKTNCNTKQNTKNDCFYVRVERDWKDKVKGISDSLGIPTSVFIRESVNKNINSFTQ